MLTLEEINPHLNTIIKEIGADNTPDPQGVEESYKYTRKELLKYLGTYFPRTYIESLILWENLFHNSEEIKQELVKLFTSDCGIKCLSIGCGCGADIFGLIDSILWIKGELEKQFLIPQNCKITIIVTAIDSNIEALNLLNEIKNKYYLSLNINNIIIETIQKDICTPTERVNQNDYDFISCFKILNELIKKNGFPRNNAINLYSELIRKLCPKLKQTGLLALADVTCKIVDDYLSIIMVNAVRQYLNNQNEYKIILPMCIAKLNNKCGSFYDCFIQQEVMINNANSKCAYFVFAQSDYALKINKWTNYFEFDETNCPATKLPNENKAFKFAYNLDMFLNQ